MKSLTSVIKPILLMTAIIAIILIANALRPIGYIDGADIDPKLTEQNSPSDWTSIENMRIFGFLGNLISVVPLDLSNRGLIIYDVANTNSMDPVFDDGSTIIAMSPESEEELVAGDIIAFDVGEPYPILHRIHSIGEDEEGWFCITKGDNIGHADNVKIRFDEINAVVIGVFY